MGRGAGGGGICIFFLALNRLKKDTITKQLIQEKILTVLL